MFKNSILFRRCLAVISVCVFCMSNFGYYFAKAEGIHSDKCVSMKTVVISSTAAGIGGAALASLIFVAYNHLKGEAGNPPEKPRFLNTATFLIDDIAPITQTEEDTDSSSGPGKQKVSLILSKPTNIFDLKVSTQTGDSANNEQSEERAEPELRIGPTAYNEFTIDIEGADNEPRKFVISEVNTIADNRLDKPTLSIFSQEHINLTVEEKNLLDSSEGHSHQRILEIQASGPDTLKNLENQNYQKFEISSPHTFGAAENSSEVSSIPKSINLMISQEPIEYTADSEGDSGHHSHRRKVKFQNTFSIKNLDTITFEGKNSANPPKKFEISEPSTMTDYVMDNSPNFQISSSVSANFNQGDSDNAKVHNFTLTEPIYQHFNISSKPEDDDTLKDSQKAQRPKLELQIQNLVELSIAKKAPVKKKTPAFSSLPFKDISSSCSKFHNAFGPLRRNFQVLASEEYGIDTYKKGFDKFILSADFKDFNNEFGNLVKNDITYWNQIQEYCKACNYRYDQNLTVEENMQLLPVYVQPLNDATKCRIMYMLALSQKQAIVDAQKLLEKAQNENKNLDAVSKAQTAVRTAQQADVTCDKMVELRDKLIECEKVEPYLTPSLRAFQVLLNKSSNIENDMEKIRQAFLNDKYNPGYDSYLLERFCSAFLWCAYNKKFNLSAYKGPQSQLQRSSDIKFAKQVVTNILSQTVFPVEPTEFLGGGSFNKVYKVPVSIGNKNVNLVWKPTGSNNTGAVIKNPWATSHLMGIPDKYTEAMYAERAILTYELAKILFPRDKICAETHGAVVFPIPEDGNTSGITMEWASGQPFAERKLEFELDCGAKSFKKSLDKLAKYAPQVAQAIENGIWDKARAKVDPENAQQLTFDTCWQIEGAKPTAEELKSIFDATIPYGKLTIDKYKGDDKKHKFKIILEDIPMQFESSDALAKALAFAICLGVLDFLLAGGDRHYQNYYVDKFGNVIAIDNDISMPLVKLLKRTEISPISPVGDKGSLLLDLPLTISKDIHNSLSQTLLDDNNCDQLKIIVFGYFSQNSAEYQHFLERLVVVKQWLRQVNTVSTYKDLLKYDETGNVVGILDDLTTNNNYILHHAFPIRYKCAKGDGIGWGPYRIFAKNGDLNLTIPQSHGISDEPGFFDKLKFWQPKQQTNSANKNDRPQTILEYLSSGRK